MQPRCQVWMGYKKVCGAPLSETLDAIGRVRWTCPACARRARGICRTCPTKIVRVSKYGPAPWFCPACERARRAARNNHSVRDDLELLRHRQLQKRRYRRNGGRVSPHSRTGLTRLVAVLDACLAGADDSAAVETALGISRRSATEALAYLMRQGALQRWKVGPKPGRLRVLKGAAAVRASLADALADANAQYEAQRWTQRPYVSAIRAQKMRQALQATATTRAA